MATKATDSCLAKVGDDEPIFVLRAQDQLAPRTVRLWALDLHDERCGAFSHLVTQCPLPKVQEARRWADAAERWPIRKLPDISTPAIGMEAPRSCTAWTASPPWCLRPKWTLW